MVVTLWPTQSPILSLWTSLVLSVSRLQVLMAPLVSPLTRTLVLPRLELAMSVMAATCWRYLASTVQYSTVQYSTVHHVLAVPGHLLAAVAPRLQPHAEHHDLLRQLVSGPGLCGGGVTSPVWRPTAMKEDPRAAMPLTMGPVI